MGEKPWSIEDLLFQKSFSRSSGLVNFRIYGKYTVYLTLRAIMLHGPEGLPCTHSFHWADDSKGFYHLMAIQLRNDGPTD